MVEGQVDQSLAKVEKAILKRRLSKRVNIVVSLVAIFLSLYVLYALIFPLPTQIQRSLFWGLFVTLVFIVYPFSSRQVVFLPWYDVVLAVLSFTIGLYWLLFYNDLVMRVAEPTRFDLVVGGIAILLTLEATRRTVGMTLPVLSILFMLYAYFGFYFGGIWGHRGFSVKCIIDHLYLTAEGVLGIPLGVCLEYVFLFVLFGAFLRRTGIGEFIMDLANSLVGHRSAGPAKVAIVASALFGTISGSSVANVVSTGSLTIPMMKKMGYRPEFAAAVEASASTGGQLMPPIMGAAAFLMAEFLGIPYVKIMMHAAIPAILYFFGVYMGVELEGRKLGLKGLPKDKIPRLTTVLKQGYLLIPIVGLVWALVSGYTPSMAAIIGIVLCILVGFFSRRSSFTFRDILEALKEGGIDALSISAVAATAGIVVGIVTLTGLGLKVANGVIALSGGRLILAALLVMLASFILGMGIPTTANYVITSTIAAPALLRLGIPPIVAHMFVFYFGLMADLTPPVAVAAYAAAAIARANPMKVGVIATSLAMGAWIIPFMFLASPQFLLIGTTYIGLLRLIITSFLGMFGLAVFARGYLNSKVGLSARVLFILGGVFLVHPEFITDLIGFGVLGCALLIHFVRKRDI